MNYTELKKNNRLDLKESIPLKYPFTLIIEPSSICNFKCVQCFQSLDLNGEPFTKKNMDLDTYQKIIDDLKDWNGVSFKVLKLSLYGEPFFNKHFCKMLKIAKEAHIADRIETTTNASLLTEEISQQLVEYGLDYIRVSIYSPYEDKFKSITKSNDSVQNIYDNLKILQDKKDQLSHTKPFVAVKMLDTYSDENEYFKNMFQNVADEVYIEKPHNWVSDGVTDFISNLYGETSETVLKDLRQNETNRVVCTLPFTTMAIRSTGDISPCCVDWIGHTTLGNVKDTSLKELWEGKALHDFRKMQLEGRKQCNKSCIACSFYANDYYILDNIDGISIKQIN